MIDNIISNQYCKSDYTTKMLINTSIKIQILTLVILNNYDIMFSNIFNIILSIYYIIHFIIFMTEYYYLYKLDYLIFEYYIMISSIYNLIEVILALIFIFLIPDNYVYISNIFISCSIIQLLNYNEIILYQEHKNVYNIENI